MAALVVVVDDWEVGQRLGGVVGGEGWGRGLCGRVGELDGCSVGWRPAGLPDLFGVLSCAGILLFLVAGVGGLGQQCLHRFVMVENILSDGNFKEASLRYKGDVPGVQMHGDGGD